MRFFNKVLVVVMGLTLCNSAYAIKHYMVSQSTTEESIYEMYRDLGPKCESCNGSSILNASYLRGVGVDIQELTSIDKNSKRTYIFKAYKKTESSTFVQKDSYISGGPSSYKFAYYAEPSAVSYASLNEDEMNKGLSLIHKDVNYSFLLDTIIYKQKSSSNKFTPFVYGDIFDDRIYGTIKLVVGGDDNSATVKLDTTDYVKYRTSGIRGFRFVLSEAYYENSKGKFLIVFGDNVPYSQLHRVDHSKWAQTYFDFEFEPFVIDARVCSAIECKAIIGLEEYSGTGYDVRVDGEVELRYKVEGNYAFDYTLERKKEGGSEWEIVKFAADDERKTLQEAMSGASFSYTIKGSDIDGPDAYFYRVKIDRINDDGSYGKEYYTRVVKLVPTYKISAEIYNGASLAKDGDNVANVLGKWGNIYYTLAYGKFGYVHYGDEVVAFTTPSNKYEFSCWMGRSSCSSTDEELSVIVTSDTVIKARFDVKTEGDYHVSIVLDTMIRKSNYGGEPDTTLYAPRNKTNAVSQPKDLDYHYGESAVVSYIEASNKKSEVLYAVIQYNVDGSNNGPWTRAASWSLGSSNAYTRNGRYVLNNEAFTEGKKVQWRVALCKTMYCKSGDEVETPIAVAYAPPIYVKHKVEIECDNSADYSCKESNVWFYDISGEKLPYNEQDTMWYYYGNYMRLKADGNFKKSFNGWQAQSTTALDEDGKDVKDESGNTVYEYKYGDIALTESDITLRVDAETMRPFRDGKTYVMWPSFSVRWLDTYIKPMQPLTVGTTELNFAYDSPFDLKEEPALYVNKDDKWVEYSLDKNAGLAPGKYRLKFKFSIPEEDDVKLMALDEGYSRVYLQLNDDVQKQLGLDGTYEANSDEVVYRYDFQLTGYTVSFFDGVDAYTQRYAAEGQFVALPEDPVKSGFDFVDWYVSEAEDAEKFNPDVALEEDVSVFAKWEEAPVIPEPESSSSIKDEAASSSSAEAGSSSSKKTESSSSKDEAASSSCEKAGSSSSKKTESSSSKDEAVSSSSEKPTLTAIAQTPRFNVTVNGRTLQILGIASGDLVAVMDMQGRVIRTETAGSSSMNVEVPQAGAYVVRAGRTNQRAFVQ